MRFDDPTYWHIWRLAIAPLFFLEIIAEIGSSISLVQLSLYRLTASTHVDNYVACHPEDLLSQAHPVDLSRMVCSCSLSSRTGGASLSSEKNKRLSYWIDRQRLQKVAYTYRTEDQIKEDHKTRIRQLDEEISALCAVLNT